MKAKMYATNNYGEFMEKPIFCGESLSGISTVLPDKNNSGRPFEGCGVAITGSSCYNLSLMDKEERRSLLKKIYSEEEFDVDISSDGKHIWFVKDRIMNVATDDMYMVTQKYDMSENGYFYKKEVDLC